MSNKSWFLIFSLSIVWSSSFLFAEVLLPYLSPVTIVFLRVGIAGLILVGLAGRHILSLKFYDILRLFVMGQINNAIPFVLIVKGQETTTGGLASILNASTGLVTIFVAAIFIAQERLTVQRCLGVFVGLVGVAICIDLSLNDLFSNQGTGKYLILLATVSYAFAAVWAKLQLSHLQPIVAAAGMSLSSALSLGCILIVSGTNEFGSIDLRVGAYVIGFAVLCSVVAYQLYFEILKTTGAGNLSLCTIIVPAFAILLDAALLDQFVTKSELSGFPIIALGLLIIDGRFIDWTKRFLKA